MKVASRKTKKSTAAGVLIGSKIKSMVQSKTWQYFVIAAALCSVEVNAFLSLQKTSQVEVLPKHRITTGRISNVVAYITQDDEDTEDDGWGDVQPSLKQEMSPSSSPVDPPERDLFIPIFSIVSLLGLFGAYGYEMFRLASRGELYLPWN